ncbi:TPA: tail fiber assembly protein [Kluyvera ascorbata]|nr:tail fiber assembly protein [Kluyvera ascorbata]
MKIKYSPGTNGFYNDSINYGDSLPNDLIDIPDNIYRNLLIGQSEGKLITPNGSNIPVLIEPAVNYVEQAEKNKAALRQYAESEIAWRQDAVDAGIATAEETAASSAWKKYRVLLMRVDTSKAPDIEWPTQPV